MKIPLLAILFAALACAQVPALQNAVPLPTPKVQLLDANGNPCAGCYLWTYAAGTSNLQATYTDSTAGTSNANPVVLDAGGFANVWVGAQSYKLVLEKPPFVAGHGSIVWTVDNVTDTTFYYLTYLRTISDSALLTYSDTGTGATTRNVRIKLNEHASVKDFGAVGNGSTDDTAALLAAFTATAGRSLYVPEGTYKINNSTGPLTIANWAGTLEATRGAKFSCTTLSQVCVKFTTPSNMTIRGLSLTFGTPWSVRNAAHMIYILQGQRITLDDIYVTNTPSSAILVEQSSHVNISNIKLVDIGANGIFATNTDNLNITNVNGAQVQDALVEVSHYDVFAGVAGGTCQYVTLSNLSGYQVFTGVLINGCADTTLNGAVFNETYGSGVSIIQDPATTTTHWPYRASVSNVSIYNTGVYPVPGSPNPLAHGIWVWSKSAAPTPVPVALSNIQIDTTAGDGIRIGNDVAGDSSYYDVTLTGIFVKSAGVSFRFTDGRNIAFSNLHSSLSKTFALYTSKNTLAKFNVIGTNFVAHNANRGNTDARIAYFDNTGDLFISGFTAIDDRNPAQATEITDSNAGAVTITNLLGLIPYGTFNPGSVTGRYLKTTDYQYKPINLIMDKTGTDSQITLTGSTNGNLKAQLGMDTTGKFGWWQAGESGVGLLPFYINPNGGNVIIGKNTNTTGANLEVTGGLAIKTPATAPSCTSTTRTVFWFNQNGNGVKDSVLVCAKDASDNYAWRTIY